MVLFTKEIGIETKPSEQVNFKGLMDNFMRDNGKTINLSEKDS